MNLYQKLHYRIYRWRHRETIAHGKAWNEGREWVLKMIEEGYAPDTDPLGYSFQRIIRDSVERRVKPEVLERIGGGLRIAGDTEVDGITRRAAEHVKREAQAAGIWPPTAGAASRKP